MVAKQRRTRRRSRASSRDIGFALALLVLAAVLLVLASVLVEQVRSAQWTSAAISGAIALVLVVIGLYSVRQRRR